MSSAKANGAVAKSFVCYNLKEAERQRKHRAMTVAILEKELESQKDASASAQGAIELLAFHRLKRYLMVTKAK